MPKLVMEQDDTGVARQTVNEAQRSSSPGGGPLKSQTASSLLKTQCLKLKSCEAPRQRQDVFCSVRELKEEILKAKTVRGSVSCQPCSLGAQKGINWNQEEHRGDKLHSKNKNNVMKRKTLFNKAPIFIQNVLSLSPGVSSSRILGLCFST